MQNISRKLRDVDVSLTMEGVKAWSAGDIRLAQVECEAQQQIDSAEGPFFSSPIKRSKGVSKMKNKKLYVIPNQHMDLVWRRCFERDIEYDGQCFVSYADIEAIYISDSIKLCKKYPFYHFSIESVAVLDKFLQRYPEQEPVIAKLIRQKQLYVPFTGNNIVDSNLVSGESIVRNYRQGYHYLKSKFGHVPDGADRNDAFGNSAQMPQILRKFGVKWAYNVTYTPCSAPYWRGLDGSTVYNIEPIRVGTVGGYPKYRPCPACHGHDRENCPVCGGRGIDQAYMDKRSFHLALQTEAIKESRLPCYILSGGEEIAPREEIVHWALENRHLYNIEFADFEAYKQYCLPQIQAVDEPPQDQVMSSPECNCNNTGVYVSRIKVKQKFRQLENTVFAAEALAAAGYLRNREYPWDAFDRIWEKTLFVMFHDAITSTHVDAGYEEVCDAIDQAQAMAETIIRHNTPEITAAQGQLFVTNPYGIGLSGTCEALLPAGCTVAGATVLEAHGQGDLVRVRFAVDHIDAYGTKAYAVVPGREITQVLFSAGDTILTGDAVLTNSSAQTSLSDNAAEDVVLENEFYRIQICDSGIREIFDKQQDAVIAKAQEYMVGEWILETDIGTPWATLSPDMRRQPLSRHTRILRHEQTQHRQTVTFAITPDVRQGFAETSFNIRWSVTLAKGVDQVLFSADVHWDTWNHRLRIAFPTALTGKHYYDIPYGMLERAPYEPRIVLPSGDGDWASAAGDYPAINWAGIDGGDQSIALFNRGTPSYQIAGDSQGAENIFLSVLRSPAMPACLHAGADYTMPLFDGMRDAGEHHFTYALKSYAGSFAANSVHADGVGYNARLVCGAESPALTLPSLRGENGWISALLPALDRKGMIVRVAEYRGRTSAFTLKLPDNIRAVWETDLKEDPVAQLPICSGKVTDVLCPFEIKSLYLEF